MSTLRAQLSNWIERAKAGEDVVITERGIPVARITAVDSAPMLDQLTQRGLLCKPSAARPTARSARRAHPNGLVSELVGEQRR